MDTPTVEEVRICRVCGQEAPISGLANPRATPKSPICKPCYNAKARARRWEKKWGGKPPPPFRHSEQTKLKLSKIAKERYSKNPDSYPWRWKNRKNNNSVPCEKFKEEIRKMGIPFVEEYPPMVEGRFFSIDVAFPDRKIGLEINGTFHYNKDGTLKPYFQERHDILERNGWTIYELVYTVAFKPDKIREIVERVLASDVKCEFDFASYVPRAKKEKQCSCGKTIRLSTLQCRECGKRERRASMSARVAETITKKMTIAEFAQTVNSIPMEKVGDLFQVAGVTIKNWCRKLGIPSPTRQTWGSRRAKINLCACGNVARRKRKKCDSCRAKDFKSERVTAEVVATTATRCKSERELASKLNISRHTAHIMLAKLGIVLNGWRVNGDVPIP